MYIPSPSIPSSYFNHSINPPPLPVTCCHSHKAKDASTHTHTHTLPLSASFLPLISSSPSSSYLPPSFCIPSPCSNYYSNYSIYCNSTPIPPQQPTSQSTPDTPQGIHNTDSTHTHRPPSHEQQKVPLPSHHHTQPPPHQTSRTLQAEK